jgi:Spherulation-specific family 4
VVAASAGVVMVAIAIAAILAHSGSGGDPTCRAALVPAYLPASAVARLALQPRRPQIVVINPDDGPGAQAQPSYRRAVRTLQATGTRVLGYVPTGYASRPLAAATADVDRYVSWYAVDGIFFDEAGSSEAQLPYYRALARHAHAAHRTVVLNPGAVPAQGYFDVADTIVTFEGPYDGYAKALQAMPGWLRSQAKERTANLVFGASRAEALQVAAEHAAGLVYVTSGTIPNPWQALPSYFQAEEAARPSCP